MVAVPDDGGRQGTVRGRTRGGGKGWRGPLEPLAHQEGVDGDGEAWGGRRRRNTRRRWSSVTTKIESGATIYCAPSRFLRREGSSEHGGAQGVVYRAQGGRRRRGCRS